MNYSFGQQYQPQHQQFQYNQNPQVNQQAIQTQQDYNRQSHLEAVKRSFENLFQIQNQPQLHYLIQIIQT